MKKYLAFAKVAILEQGQKIVDGLGTIFSFCVHIVIFSFLWDFVLEGKTMSGYSRQELVWYVIMAEDGSLTLTELGKDVANKIFERHTILSKLLVHIGVSEDVAAKEACKIEHVISDDTLLKIKNFLKI